MTCNTSQLSVPVISVWSICYPTAGDRTGVDTESSVVFKNKSTTACVCGMSFQYRWEDQIWSSESSFTYWCVLRFIWCFIIWKCIIVVYHLSFHLDKRNGDSCMMLFVMSTCAQFSWPSISSVGKSGVLQTRLMCNFGWLCVLRCRIMVRIPIVSLRALWSMSGVCVRLW